MPRQPGIQTGSKQFLSELFDLKGLDIQIGVSVSKWESKSCKKQKINAGFCRSDNGKLKILCRTCLDSSEVGREKVISLLLAAF
jgi:hypothetical protein